MKQTLLITERKIKTFEPTKERDGSWRTKTNDKLSNLMKNKDITNYIKAQGLSWFVHVYQMTNDRMVKKLYEW
jgi:hypothetical protein